MIAVKPRGTRRLFVSMNALMCGCLLIASVAAQEGGPFSPGETASEAPAEQVASIGMAQPCPTCAPCCSPCCCGHQGCLARYMSSVGGFNCSCRGSYKFPVPPQYTYHWPGLYSQQLMSSYQSPYRYPTLKLPPWMEKGTSAGSLKSGTPLMPSPGDKQDEGKPIRQ